MKKLYERMMTGTTVYIGEKNVLCYAIVKEKKRGRLSAGKL
jgi:hypothetical protein